MMDIKRIYEEFSKSDGFRVLVDRLWPRGVSKERAHLDRWMKDVAPSPELREWFDHEASRFDEFSRKYRQELETDSVKGDCVKELIDMEKDKKVTLLYAAKSPSVNHAVVLLGYIRDKKA